MFAHVSLQIVHDLIESLDVLPTILELWGTCCASDCRINGTSLALDGESLLPYLSARHGQSDTRSAQGLRAQRVARAGDD